MNPGGQNKSSFSKCICSIRFLIILIICIVIVSTIAYFVSMKTGENISNNDRDQTNKEQGNGQSESNKQDPNENSGNDIDLNHNDTITVETTTESGISKWENNEEIRIFREYLRIPTVHPDIDYKPAVVFLQRQAVNLNLPTSISYPVDKENPVLVMTWKGTQPELPSIILNSHMDVVPAYEEFWSHPPFDAEMDENGDIFARGAQDMKSVGTQYLGAIRALKREGIDRFKRTIHLIYVPDEEVSDRGMIGFVKTGAFKSLNAGFLLDEGDIITPDELNVFYGERTILQTEFTFHGQSGHGSMLLDDTPGEKMSYLIGKFTEFRKEETRKLKEQNYPYGNVTTINLTVVKGGVESNVIPAEMKAIYDIRVSVNEDLDQFIQMMSTWCREAGGNITMRFLDKGEKEPLTVVDASNEYWVAFKRAVDELGLNVVPAVMGGATDSRYIRRLNISALGFSPFKTVNGLKTVNKMHDHNEYLNADVYLNGIDVYKKIIRNLANV